jgi:hypothetical protein
MSVSGVTSFTMTAYQIIERAFNILGVGSEGEALTARMYEDGLQMLNMLIKAWGAQEHLWTRTERMLVPIANQAAYDLSASGKPMRVEAVRRRYANVDTPLLPLARQDYFDMPNKTLSASVPTSFYYDPQQATGVLYLWPAPSATFVASQTLTYTCLRRMSDMLSANDEVDLPQEWLKPIVWNLANDLETQYPVNDGRIAVKIERQANDSYKALKGWDNEPVSIYLQPETLWGDWRA